MTDAQKTKYNALLNAQIATLNAANTALDTASGLQVSNLQTFVTAQDTIFDATINGFAGTTDQLALLTAGKAQFDAAAAALITKAQTSEETADGQMSAAIARLTDLIQ